MIPHEKEMVKRLADSPFALIGINSDGGQAALQKIMKQQGLTWRQAVDGTTGGPIATRWNVNGWPTIYVLDHKGVVRFRLLGSMPQEEDILNLINEILQTAPRSTP